MIMRAIVVLTFLVITVMTAGTVLADLESGLVAHYPFNGNADDESGNGNDGIVNGATLTSDRFGNIDSAYSFDGNDIILVDDDPSLEPSTALTLSAWIRTPTGSWGDDNVISKEAKIGSLSNGYLLRTGAPEDEILFYAGGEKPTGPDITTDEWLHVVGTYDAGTRMAIFINAVQFSEITSGVPPSIPYAGGDLGIGGPFDLIGGFFNGMIDDIHLYNRVLSDTEIQELFNLGNVKNISVDIKPRKWPNVLHIKCGKQWGKRKKLRVAILGSENFDVNTIDPDSIRLNGVKHKRHKVVDIAAPSVLELCDGEVTVPDTWADLVLTYKVKSIIKSVIDTQEVHDGDTVKLEVTGNLIDGTAIKGEDCVLFRVKKCKDDDISDGRRRCRRNR